MRLHLPFEAPWQILEPSEDRFVAVLPGASGPDAVVTYGPIVARPEDPRRWLEGVLRFDLPAGMKIEITRSLDAQTAAEWPVRVVEATVSGPDGAVAEVRICALYTFMEHGAAAIARTPDRARLDAHGQAILTVLQRGRPDWRGEPVCLAEAFDLRGSMEVLQRQAVRALYAAGRFEYGETARTALRNAWMASRDARVALVNEYVFDEFDGDGFSVRAYETLRPHNPAMYPVLAFRAFQRHHDHEHALPAAVLVETSEQAKAAGTPYVLSAIAGASYRVLGTAKELPAYADLKHDVLQLIRDALRASSTDVG